MDTKKRLFMKSITWQVAGLITMILIGFIFTQSITASGGIAIVGSLAGFISYFLHELIWSKVNWGKRQGFTSNGGIQPASPEIDSGV